MNSIASDWILQKLTLRQELGRWPQAASAWRWKRK